MELSQGGMFGTSEKVEAIRLLKHPLSERAQGLPAPGQSAC